jgi:coenzyme F420-reducing hydrogenase gamma subunit
LTLLDCEDELLDLVDAFDIALFREATRSELPGRYDLALVEGSISTADDARRIRQIRKRARRLVTIGACATAGGIQSLRNFAAAGDYLAAVYPRPQDIATLATSTPIRDHVAVDFELHGCPIDKRQLIEVLKAFLHGRRPNIPQHSVCIDCKRQGIVCVLVAHGTPCLGPVTRTGCGVLCPPLGRGCYGCFGPMETPNAASLGHWLRQTGVGRRAVGDLFRSFNAGAPAFSEANDRDDGE